MRATALLSAFAILMVGTLHGAPVEVAPPPQPLRDYYGTSPFDPMVRQNVVTIRIPGGRIEYDVDGSAAYLITDHLGSGRLHYEANMAGAIEYDPSGRPSPSPSEAVYATHVYDPQQATYDALARSYDPDIGRFLGRDAVPGDASPYAYAGSNSINAVDPDGRETVHFLMYSNFGVNQPDNAGRRSLRSDVVELHAATRGLKQTVVMSPIESTGQNVLPVGIEAGHLTLVAHGNHGVVNLWDSLGGRRMDLSGDAFAYYLHAQMEHQYGPSSTETLQSIYMANCYGACRTRSSIGSGMREDSFADVFARSAREYFPRLEHVTASPYRSGAGVFVEHEGVPSVVVEAANFTYRRDADARVVYSMDPDDFFTGRFPAPMHTTPGRAMQTINERYDRPVHIVLEEQSSVDSVVTDRDQMRDIIHRYRDTFSEPVLREIPVLPPPAGE